MTYELQPLRLQTGWTVQWNDFTEYDMAVHGPEDEELILSFVRALADYEHMSDQVVTTPEILREWIFEKKTAEVIFAEVEGKAVGYALFFHNFSTFLGRAGVYLEDLFVLPGERGRGYGRLEWACLDWNQPSIDFYTKKMRAVPMDEWTVYRLTGETLEETGRPG